MAKKISFFKSLDKLITEIPVSEIMVKNIKTLKEDDDVQKVVDLMADFSISGVLIDNADDYPVGIVTEGDVLKKVLHKKKDPKKVRIKDIMTKHLFTITPELSIGETAALMKKHNISKLPVVEHNKLVGYVTKSDLLEELNEIYYQNARLKWLPLVFVMLLIVIAILVFMYINK